MTQHHQSQPHQVHGRAASKQEYVWPNPPPVDAINLGSLQRIADALESIVVRLRHVETAVANAADALGWLKDLTKTVRRLDPAVIKSDATILARMTKGRREEKSRQRALLAYLKASGKALKLSTDFDPPLPPGVLHYLDVYGIRTLADLVDSTPKDILNVRGIGPTALTAIRKWLATFDLALTPDSGDDG